MSDINYSMMETRWAKLQSNHGVWATILLSIKSCILTNDYTFWPSGKRFIQQMLLLTQRSRLVMETILVSIKGTGFEWGCHGSNIQASNIAFSCSHLINMDHHHLFRSKWEFQSKVGLLKLLCQVHSRWFIEKDGV